MRTAWLQTWEKRDRRPIWEWARENVWLVPPITRIGWFDTSGSRHFEPIFSSLQNDHKREVNILKPVRGGGSLIGDVWCPWTLVNDPGPFMDVFQTDLVAGEHGSMRIRPVFDHCKRLRQLYPGDRHHLCDKQIDFTHGHSWFLSGPSIGNLQTKGIRYLRLEEVWMWAQGKMGEAIGRVGDFIRMQTSKVLCISQGGPAPGQDMQTSDWFRHYHRGQIFEWEVACQHCGKYFDPVFSGKRTNGSFWGITWDRHMLPGGDWDIPKCLPTIRFECPHCGQPSLDGSKTKSEWNRTGKYRAVGRAEQIEVPGEPKPEEDPRFCKRDSFHWESVIDFPWDELVELWLDSCNAERRGDLQPKLQFYQKRRAMFKDEESLLKGGLHFRRAAYEINSEWPEEKSRFLTVDRQEEDMFWWTVRAWSPDKSRKLGFGKAYGFAAVEEVRERFKVAPNHTFMDSNYMPKGDHGVYAACLRHGWIAVRGAKEYGFIHRLKSGRRIQKSYSPLSWGDPGSGTTQGNRRYCPLIMFSKPQMNQKTQELIDQGRWEEPLNSADQNMEDEYSAQMAARVRKTEFNAKTGQTSIFWFEGRNDHARDLANMQCLGAILEDLLPDPAMERLTKTESEQLEKAAAEKGAA